MSSAPFIRGRGVYPIQRRCVQGSLARTAAGRCGIIIGGLLRALFCVKVIPDCVPDAMFRL